MKKKISKEKLLREVIKKQIKSVLKESWDNTPLGDVGSELEDKALPMEFVKRMVRHADRFTSQKIKLYVWNEIWSKEIKTSKDLIKELKGFIPKEKHAMFMELAEMLVKRYNLK